MEKRLFEERRSWEPPRWRRQAAGIAAGLCALVLSVSALALAAALHERADDAGGRLAVLTGCAAQPGEAGCAGR